MNQLATRITNQRMMILETLRDSHSHLTADDLYVRVRKTMPNISLGTVYRNLGALSDSGKIMTIHTPGGSSYYDGNITPHKHMLCNDCGCVFDLPEDQYSVHIDMQKDMQITGYDLLVHCICGKCAKKKP